MLGQKDYKSDGDDLPEGVPEHMFQVEVCCDEQDEFGKTRNPLVSIAEPCIDTFIAKDKEILAGDEDVIVADIAPYRKIFFERHRSS